MTEEEKQELEALRKEKHLRAQQARAAAGLKDAGVPAEFASLLAGSDDADTDARTAQFCTAYQSAVTTDIRSRLPQQAPVVAAPSPARARRGIQRIR